MTQNLIKMSKQNMKKDNGLAFWVLGAKKQKNHLQLLK